MIPLPPHPTHTVMSKGQKCLPVASMCVCACAHACTHVCTYVSYLFGHGVCVHVSVCSCMYGEGVYALPPVLKFSKALITQSSTGLLRMDREAK